MGDRAEDGPGPVLIATKPRPPPVRDQVIPRERLAYIAGSPLSTLIVVPAKSFFARVKLRQAFASAAMKLPSRAS